MPTRNRFPSRSLRGLQPARQLERLLRRAEDVLGRVETLLPDPQATALRRGDWDRHIAFRWRKRGYNGTLEGISGLHRIALSDLLCMEEQKAELVRNTRQFVLGHPANNTLLWGSRGTGKSSLIKAVLNEFAADGLRLIEVDKHDLIALPDIVTLVAERPERFVIYCDDLSFEAEDPSYKSLKAVLDGSIAQTADNVLIYATSNRRHLMPEFMRENLDARLVDTEIHHGEGVEEKISLSERFGLWLSFYPFSQEQYLKIANHWLDSLGVSRESPETIRAEALRWALKRGSRSGRVAWQFARDWAGRRRL